jgi:hypothetical protein
MRSTISAHRFQVADPPELSLGRADALFPFDPHQKPQRIFDNLSFGGRTGQLECLPHQFLIDHYVRPQGIALLDVYSDVLLYTSIARDP